MRPLKLALFAPYLPAPAQSGGRIRIHEHARALCAFAEVHLFASAGASDEAAHRGCAELELYSSVSCARAHLAFLPSFRGPARVRRAAPRQLLAAFEREDARRPFDALVTEHVHAAGLVRLLRRMPWVLDEHNIESDYVRACGAVSRTPWVHAFSAAWLRRYEATAWKRASAVVCVSESDADRIASVRGERPFVVPNGVRAATLPFRAPSSRSGHDILFVGVLGHPPNAAAARFLAQRVLPRVRAREPRARLVLCGADPAPAVRALADECVIVTGRVPDVAPYLDAARVYANALGAGAGTSLKVLEALASGIPLVSTQAGVRGFPLETPHHYLRAETPDEMAEGILAAFTGTAERDATALRGRRFAERHDFRILAPRFAEIVERTARGGLLRWETPRLPPGRADAGSGSETPVR